MTAISYTDFTYCHSWFFLSFARLMRTVCFLNVVWVDYTPSVRETSRTTGTTPPKFTYLNQVEFMNQRKTSQIQHTLTRCNFLQVAFIKKKKNWELIPFLGEKIFSYLFALCILSNAMVEIGVTIAASNKPSVLSSLIRNRAVSVVYLTDQSKVSLTYERAFLQDVKSYRKDY